jgi:predicted dehydrogenase
MRIAVIGAGNVGGTLGRRWAEAGAFADALNGVALLDASDPLGPNFALQFGPNGELGGEQVQAMVPAPRVPAGLSMSAHAADV